MHNNYKARQPLLYETLLTISE